MELQQACLARENATREREGHRVGGGAGFLRHVLTSTYWYPPRHVPVPWSDLCVKTTEDSSPKIFGEEEGTTETLVAALGGLTNAY